MKNTFTTAFNRKSEFIRNCNVVEFKKPSMVKQSLAYATDINTIYDNYCKTGRLPLNGQQPIYDENFVKYDSLIEAQKMVEQATLYFNGLPAKIKNQYGNSLEKFILALNSKDDYLVKEGVLKLTSESPTIDEKLSTENNIPADTNIPNVVQSQLTDTAKSAD